MNSQANKHIRASQIAKEFPISQASIWRYAKQGRLNPIKVTDGVTVFLRSEVEALFGGKTVEEVSA